MTKRIFFLVLGISVLLGACLGAEPQENLELDESLTAIVYKDPT